VDSNKFTDWHTSLQIGSDGMPIIAYLDNEKNVPKIAFCQDIMCNTVSIVILNNLHEVLSLKSIMGIDGNLLLILKQNISSVDTVVAVHCSDKYCTNMTSSTVASPAEFSVATLSGDGKVCIFLSTNNETVIAHCNDLKCTSNTVSSFGIIRKIVTTATDIVGYPIAISSGFSAAYYRCLDFACNNWTTSSPIPFKSDHFPVWFSLVLGVDGFPFFRNSVGRWIRYHNFCNTLHQSNMH